MISKAAVAAAIATLVARRVTAAPLSESDVTTKVVGGDVAPNGAFPFIVSLSSGGNHFCGGSLLNAEYVLTASHCLFNPPPNIQVRAGSNDRTTGGTVVSGVDPKTHPGFTMEGLDNDVALLRLSPPLNNQSANIEFVKMPQKNSDPQEGTKTVAGWGLLQDKGRELPEDLRQLSVPLVPREKCNQQVSSLAGKRITENMICAGQVGKDSCNGDSGGPLIDAQTGVLQGVVSFGFGCANEQLPGVYARVDTQLDFIQSVMDGKSPTQPGPPSQTPGGNPGNPPTGPPGGNPGNPPSGPPGSNPGSPGAPGDGDFNPGNPGAPGEGGFNPGQPGAPGEGGFNPGQPGAPGEGGFNPGQPGAPGEGGFNPGQPGAPGEGGFNPGQPGAPGEGGFNPGQPGAGIDPGDGSFPGGGIAPGGSFPGDEIAPGGGGFPGFEGDDEGLNELIQGIVGGF